MNETYLVPGLQPIDPSGSHREVGTVEPASWCVGGVGFAMLSTMFDRDSRLPMASRFGPTPSKRRSRCLDRRGSLESGSHR